VVHVADAASGVADAEKERIFERVLFRAALLKAWGRRALDLVGG